MVPWAYQPWTKIVTLLLPPELNWTVTCCQLLDTVQFWLPVSLTPMKA